VAISLEEPAAVDLGQAPETFQVKELGHALQLREVFLDECVGKILQILGSQRFDGRAKLAHPDPTLVSPLANMRLNVLRPPFDSVTAVTIPWR